MTTLEFGNSVSECAKIYITSRFEYKLTFLVKISQYHHPPSGKLVKCQTPSGICICITPCRNFVTPSGKESWIRAWKQFHKVSTYNYPSKIQKKNKKVFVQLKITKKT